MKTIAALLAAALLFASTARADNCSPRVNYAIDPSQIGLTVFSGWAQWLNSSYIWSCSGQPWYYTCQNALATVYVSTYGSSTDGWTVFVWNQNFTDTARLGPGFAWGWTWETGLMGHVSTKSNGTFGTCD